MQGRHMLVERPDRLDRLFAMRSVSSLVLKQLMDCSALGGLLTFNQHANVNLLILWSVDR